MARSAKPDHYWKEASLSPLFEGLEESDIRAMLRQDGIRVQCVTAGAELNVQGELAILISGTARVTKQADGHEVIMSDLRPGALFGAAGLFQRDALPVTRIRARERCRALLIPEAVLRQLMAESSAIMENYIRYLTGRIRFLTGRIDGFIRPSVRNRLLHFLEEHMVDNRVPLPSGMNALAKQLSVSRPSLYRVIGELTEEGILAREKGALLLLKKPE